MMGPTKLREVREGLATGVAGAPPAAPTADELEALARSLAGHGPAPATPSVAQPDGPNQPLPAGPPSKMRGLLS